MNLIEVLEIISENIDRRRNSQQRFLIGVDGVDGAGKSFFAANLANHLQAKNIPVLNISIDGFHRPRAERYAKGKNSPEGFYYDSYDYDRFKSEVILPFIGDEQYIKTAIHDVETDQQLSPEPVHIQHGAVLIIDGMFLHRDKLAQYWDYSIFLDVDFHQTFQRMATRDNNSPDPFEQHNSRYREGQLLYFQECSPKSRATMVIDNSDFKHPKIIKD